MRRECNIAATRCGMLLQTHIRATADYLTFHADKPAPCAYLQTFAQNRKSFRRFASRLTFNAVINV